MKVLFLDIDGVLNCNRTALAFGGYPMELDELGAFDRVAIHMLQAMCRADESLKIVLSSAWRLHFPHDKVGIALGLPIIDRTPHLLGPRGMEINSWLADHPEVVMWAIVDDDCDMLPDQQTRFVRTSHEEGLSWANYVMLCHVLGISEYEGKPRSRNWRNPSEHLQWDDVEAMNG